MGQTFIETFTGKRFTPLKPRVEDVCLEDIAHALAHQCRFGGHTRFHYSVAQHSVHVANLIGKETRDPNLALWGLLHDASEAYLVDLPSPLKVHPGFAYYKTAEKRLMGIICDAFKIPRKEPEIVRWADAVILATEARDIMPYRADHWAKLKEKPLEDLTVKKWSAKESRYLFVQTYLELESRRWMIK